MELYVYEKWDTKIKEGWGYDETEERAFSIDNHPSSGSLSNVSGWDGFVIEGGTIKPGTYSRRITIYAGESGELFTNFTSKQAYRYTVESVSTGAVSASNVFVKRMIVVPTREIIKGDNLLEVMITNDNTLPNNGHRGGVWYVRKSIATPPKLISPNGGEVITWKHKITWINATPTQQTRIELSTNNGSSWQVLTTVGKGETSYEHDFLNNPASSLALIRVAHYDGQYTGAYDTSSGVFQIDHNRPPTMPNNLQPDNKPIDSTKMQFLTWKFNDPDVNDNQTKFDLRYRVQGTNNWINISEVSTDSGKAFPPNSFALGRIEWQVRTYDRKSEVSPWSNLAIFTSSLSVEQPIITSPGNVVFNSNPVISWTSPTQVAYQVKVTDSGGGEVYKSAEVTSNSKAMTLPYTLLNGASYTISVRVKTANGLWSDWTHKEVTTNYVPPAKPEISASATTYGLLIDVSNPEPTNNQPNVYKVEIYKWIDDGWLLVSDTQESYPDMYAMVGSNRYKAIVYGDNGAVNESNIIMVDFFSEDTTFVNTRTKKKVDILNILDTNVNRTPEKAYHLFKGRSRLVPEVGLHTNRQISLTWLVQSVDDLQNYTESFNPHDIYLYRDREGRKFFVTIDNLDESEDYEFNDYQMSMSMTEVDFYEGIDRDE